jgi:5-formyltetrahydrofolate cyclo-ligase
MMVLPEQIHNKPLPHESKTLWRDWAKAQRLMVCNHLLTKAVAQHRMVMQLYTFIKNSPNVQTVGLFLPLPYEPNLLALMGLMPHINWMMPRVGKPEKGELKTALYFHSLPQIVVSSIAAATNTLINIEVSTRETLGFVQNPWQLWEPPATWPLAPPIDLLIIPALSMDDQGIRLGYGGGFYDRWLATSGYSANTLGVCWEACRVPILPSNERDVPLVWVCTEAIIQVAK